MIELEGISKTFAAKGHQVEAVRDVTLHIDKNEIYGIIGFSGAGKSTLVRCINLLERPDRGRVILEGNDLTKLSARELRAARKDIGMIFQHF
ncbi:MAG: ATP-binding cassette domain-containing protein, partial [Oscillospiraceae bacterium]|nr:ATP-binding cassette domain-containing protein [Oscillospiraceae bacterium]